MLLARDPEAASALRNALAKETQGRGGFVSYRIAEEGMRIRVEGKRTGDELSARAVSI